MINMCLHRLKSCKSISKSIPLTYFLNKILGSSTQVGSNIHTILYVFDVVDSQYFKFGFTAQSNPWNRIQNGFWTNLHPMELCGKLGSQTLNLVHVFEGDYNLEKCIQNLFPPQCGEFWEKDDLPKIIEMLRLMTHDFRT